MRPPFRQRAGPAPVEHRAWRSQPKLGAPSLSEFDRGYLLGFFAASACVLVGALIGALS